MLENELKAEAQRLGFLLAGITWPQTPAHLAVYENWLAAGRHAQMHYLATERGRACRADVNLLQPGTRSILVLAWPYPSAGLLSGETQVAAYAHGEDYHTLIPPKLQQLADWLRAASGREIRARGYTDTGPILERELAQQAGLGWIGRNTCLISPRHGSYFLLAELLLGVDLQPDAPFISDRCGTCQRCVQACPTGAILPDRTLDARRCISYLTIENKGGIPAEWRAALGRHVFGCDICQQVCPWNARAPGSSPPAEHLNLAEELGLNAQAFNQKYRQRAIQRAKRRGWLRNVAVVLGNRRDPADLPALKAALLRDDEPLVRAHAAWALGCYGSPPAVAVLTSAAAAESDPLVREEIQRALKNAQGTQSGSAAS